uniref:Cytochrome b n=1 Tax=Wallacidia oculata TaxID=590134 RepID=E0WBP4_9HYME|nr:cytochrome b [Wallacidia oculata]
MINKMAISCAKKKYLWIPMPSNINIWYNLGSLIATCLGVQIMSGLMLSMNYCANMNYAFNSVMFINQETFLGFILRNIHVNGASFFFLIMFLHIMRGLYQFSFNLTMTWTIGVLLLMLSMSTAFLGYILPWGQMSFWGATVITNLMSVIPYIGPTCVEWLWGGFSVGNPTLSRFYSLHFFLPMIITIMVILHLLSLHMTGSSNPLGTQSTIYMVPFHPYYTIKDLVGVLMLMIILMLISFLNPDMLMDPDNFTIASPFMTPRHIKPEWYFLYAYAILRSIPSKFGGVICLMLSILILLLLPLLKTPKMNNMKFYPLTALSFWNFVNVTIMLTWLGSKPTVYPYMQLSQLLSIFYFMYFFLFHWLSIKMDTMK